MSKALSQDLRDRVVAAIDSGLSRQICTAWQHRAPEYDLAH